MNALNRLLVIGAFSEQNFSGGRQYHAVSTTRLKHLVMN